MPLKRVAVLGAGIMGASTALMLARRGIAVTLIDRAAAPMSGASRWNEGKIHLGYLYGADPSLATARTVLPGGLAFGRVVHDLLAADLTPHFTFGNDTYLVHRNSVAAPTSLTQTFTAIDELVRAHPDFGSQVGPLERHRKLTAAELATFTQSPDIVAGFAVPERSIDTQWLADGYTAALLAEPLIELRLNTVVQGASPVDSVDGHWRLAACPHIDGDFDLVINALWEGRLTVDVGAGLAPIPGWSHRYRLALFVRTDRPLWTPSTLVFVGPYGGVKNHDGMNFYLHWYPAGLRAQGHELMPPEPPALDAAEEASLIAGVRAGLAPLLSGVDEIMDHAAQVKVRGAYVFAQGQGALDDIRSSLHRRDCFGIRRRGNYLSIDTGKFSTAPFLAEQLVAEVTA